MTVPLQNTKNLGTYVPNICSNSNILIVLIFGQLVAVIVCILLYESLFSSKLGTVSLYIHWVTLSFCALLCFLRKWIIVLKKPFGSIVVFFIGMNCFLVTELLSQSLFLFSNQAFDWSRLCLFSVIAIISTVTVLWCFEFASKLNSRNTAESNARMQALQARIQPHFLFNTLNSISELTATQPDKAESAIQSLSMLFRVSLEEGSNLHSLDKEIRLCERYIELEMWRCGDRVDVEWSVNVEKLSEVSVPKLILQPLVENAIKYGVDSGKSSAKSRISISIQESSDFISIKTENPVVDQKQIAGNGLAINNIKERLFVLYDDQQSFNVRDDSSNYQIIIKIPKL